MTARLRWPAIAALAMVCCIHVTGSAQVIEERKGESNPSTVIFRATLYGAGTGLLLGGAYALVEEDDDLSTGEVLKWGVASGAAVGFLIGLVHVVTRPEPKGDAEEVGSVLPEKGTPRLAAPRILLTERRDMLGNRHGNLEVGVVRMTF